MEIHWDNYIWEKLYSSIRSLIGPGNQRERLLNACINSLTFAEGKVFPDKRSEKMFGDIMEKLKVGEPKADEGLIAASINELNDLEVNRAIEDILSLYDHVTRHMNPIV